MKKSTIRQSIFTSENDLSKTQNTKEIIEKMVEGRMKKFFKEIRFN